MVIVNLTVIPFSLYMTGISEAASDYYYITNIAYSWDYLVFCAE